MVMIIIIHRTEMTIFAEMFEFERSILKLLKNENMSYTVGHLPSKCGWVIAE